jgi:RHS repeat-associated protein
VTSLRGVTYAWNSRGTLLSATPPAPQVGETYGIDAWQRRVSRVRGTSSEFYVYDGADRIAVLAPDTRDAVTGIVTPGVVVESYLFDGIDHPLRLKRGAEIDYFELDLAGNVRRLRSADGTDLGGDRYSAFGQTVENDALVSQPFRWKGVWRFDVGGNELYDARARMWSPALASFLSVDEFVFHDPSSTLWSWPGQNPVRWRDPSGHWRDDSPERKTGANTPLGTSTTR